MPLVCESCCYTPLYFTSTSQSLLRKKKNISKMSSSGRKLSSLWDHFERVQHKNGWKANVQCTGVSGHRFCDPPVEKIPEWRL